MSDGTLLNWGRLPYSSKAYDLDLSSNINVYNVKKSCPGSYYHNAYIDYEGNLWTWGYNRYGGIGNGENNDSFIKLEDAYKVMDNVKDVACGSGFGGYTMAVIENGKLYEWGENVNYQITEYTDEVTVLVPYYILWGEVDYIYTSGRTSYWITNDIANSPNALIFQGFFRAEVDNIEESIVACGATISKDVIMASANMDKLPYFIKTDNTLWKCNYNIDSNSINEHVNLRYNMLAFTYNYEIKTIKVADNVKFITGSDTNGMYIKTDGSLWSWGENVHGEMGNGTICGNEEFPTVENAIKIMDNVKSVSFSRLGYSLILKEDGSIWGCGNNEYGNLKPIEANVDGNNILTPELIWQSIKAPTATAIRINANKSTIGREEQLPLQLLVEPSDAFCKNIQWQSSDESIATVSQRGIVTGISEGEVTITATVESHEGVTFEASCHIMITKTSALPQVLDKKINCQIHNSILQLDNLTIGTKVEVYNTTGIRCYHGTADGQRLYIPLDERGVYIVCIGNERIKIVNL